VFSHGGESFAVALFELDEDVEEVAVSVELFAAAIDSFAW
jgi:hypothetical protein